MNRKDLIELIAYCEEWKALIKAHEKQSRERSLIVTKLDEARLWASEVLTLEDANMDMP